MDSARNNLSGRRPKGTILMEVVLALGLFFLAGSVVYGGLSASYGAIGRVRLTARAADLAVTKLAEVHLGELEPVSDGPNLYDEADLAGWSWEIAVTELEGQVQLDPAAAPPMLQMEVIVRNDEAGSVYRLVELIEQEDVQ